MSDQPVNLEKQQFDLRVHVRDPKTGFVVRKQPYRLTVDREQGEVFHRGGKRYYRDGTLIDKETSK